jgi:hypothetical protein
MMNRRVRSLGTMLLLVAMPVLAADSLAVKTGLWETTVTTSMSGMSLPADVLAKMQPAQRAQMEQMMKQMGTGAPRTMKDKSCVTEKQLREGAFTNVGNDADQRCKYTPVSASARHQELTFQCSNAGHSASGRMVVDATDSTHVQGTADVKSESANLNIKFAAQWLSSSCAGADAK